MTTNFFLQFSRILLNFLTLYHKKVLFRDTLHRFTVIVKNHAVTYLYKNIKVGVKKQLYLAVSLSALS
jgi:hypothetical protein